MRKIPLIIDTDPGHDDVVAILVALSSEKIDLRAITTVQGNQTLDKTTANALRITEFVKSDVPVAMGAAKPMATEIVTATGHGVTGLDGSTMPPPTKKPAALSAVEQIAKVLEESDIPVTICILGPCMNIATFLLAYPHLKEKIARFSIMGGGFVRGNRSPAAEMNIFADPLAAQIVFQSGVPISLFALDVTLKTGMTLEDLAALEAQKDPLSQEIYRFMCFYRDSSFKRGRKMVPVHDACTVAWLIAPEIFTMSPAYAEVDLCGRSTRGATIIDFDCLSGKTPNILFAVGSDREKMIALVLEAFRKVGSRL